MEGWTDGWWIKDRWVDARMDGWMVDKGEMGGCKNGRIGDGCMDA